MSAYLVANANILIALWDGREYNVRGGTYDSVRMAYYGIDQDLIQKMPPSAVAERNLDPRYIQYLNAGEDTLIYWIEVKRRTADAALKERHNCMNVERTPGNCCGFIYRDDLQIQRDQLAENTYVRKIKKMLSIKDRDYHPDKKTAIKSGPILDGVDAVYDDIPSAFDYSFRRIRDINREISELTEKEKERPLPRDGLYSDPDEMENDPIGGTCMTEMKRKFWLIDALSRKYDSSTHRNTLILIVLQAAATAFFSLMILFSTSAIFTILYAVTYVLLTGLMWLHKERREHARYIEYRSLAESIRIQYHWGILGINDSVTMNCYGYLKNGMSWMRVMMKGICSAASNDYLKPGTINMSDRIDYAEKFWIKDKIAHLETVEDNKLKKIRVYSITAKILETALTVIAFYLIVMTVLPSIGSNTVVATMPAMEFARFSLLQESEITMATNIKILIIIMTFILSLLVAVKTQTFTNTAEQSKAKRLMYQMVLSKMKRMRKSKDTHTRKNNERLQDILHEIGVQEIDQNNDWVFQFIGKDVEKKKNGINPKSGESKGPEPPSA